jgi:hypothetical protein
MLIARISPPNVLVQRYLEQIRGLSPNQDFFAMIRDQQPIPTDPPLAMSSPSKSTSVPVLLGSREPIARIAIEVIAWLGV